LLAYVWVDDLMVNAELVRQGYAQVMTVPPNVRYQALFLKLQGEARAARRGLDLGEGLDTSEGASTAPSEPSPRTR
jgi:hypothetical protein